MSIEKTTERPEWIKDKRISRKELEALKEIMVFYLINTPYEDYSCRSIPVTEYQWPSNIWNLGTLKEQLLHFANLTLNYNLFAVDHLDKMSDICQLNGFGADFYKNHSQERILVYVNSNSNIILSILKNIRNALAHGRFTLYPTGDDFMMILESVDKNNKTFEVKARMVLRISTLLKWKEIIQNGPQKGRERVRRKK